MEGIFEFFNGLGISSSIIGIIFLLMAIKIVKKMVKLGVAILVIAFFLIIVGII